MNPFDWDPFQLDEFRANVEKLYADLAALFANTQALYTPPGWFPDVYGSAAGLTQFLAGTLLIMLLLFVLLLFGWGAEYIPKAIAASIALAIAINLAWTIVIEASPSIMSGVAGAVQQGTGSPPAVTPPTGTLTTLMTYIPAYALGGMMTALVKILPYMSWVCVLLFLFGLAFVAVGGKGGRLAVMAMFGVLAGSILGFPLVYLCYVAALNQGSSNGVVVTFTGWLLLVLAFLVPIIILLVGLVTQVVVKRLQERSQSDVSGDVNASVDNTVNAELSNSQLDVSHSAVNLDLYNAQLDETQQESFLPGNVEQAPDRDDGPSDVGQKVDAIAAGALVAGHPEVSAALETARPLIEERFGNRDE